VAIICPACGASEDADPATLAGAPRIVCRKCGETWSAAPRRRPRHAAVRAPSRALVEAERRPLVTFSGASDTQAWQAKMDADVAPAPQRPSRIPMTAAAVASLLFLAAFIGGRHGAVAALPDLAGLYGAVGLPVSLTDLAIETVQAERESGAEAGLRVSGSIRNLGRGAEGVPPLTAGILDAAGAPLASYGFTAPAERLKAGEATAFLLELPDVPRHAATVVIRFRQPADPVTAGIEDGTAAQ
jgi:hypothetical protein